MTPLPPITDPPCIRVKMTITDAAAIAAGTGFFLSYSSDAPSGAELATLATAIRTSWQANLASLTNDAEALTSVTLQDMASDTGNVGEVEGTWGGGESDNEPFTAGVCAVINHTISRHYRGGHCRNYLRIGDRGDLDGSNKFSTGFVGELKTAWQAFIAAILADETSDITLVNLVQVSYYDLATWTGPSGGPYKRIPTKRDSPLVNGVTDSNVAVKLGSQRRRLKL
jgi:hypothetical protein